jgi:DNA integrity scanning protein DisA with diadenylate cyclase activity
MRDMRAVFCDICSEKRGVDPKLLEELIILGVEIAREGREGRKIGTMFVLGDEHATLARSHNLILDPLYGHDPEIKRISNIDMRETLKELAQLDGAFIVSDDGIVLSACRHMDASAHSLKLPMGLGSRHVAAASITVSTDAVAVVVSESAVVRVFDDGELISEIIPELWLMSRYAVHLEGPYKEHSDDQLTVVSKEE